MAGTRWPNMARPTLTGTGKKWISATRWARRFTGARAKRPWSAISRTNLRSGDPDAMDQIVAITFANVAVDLIREGIHGRLTAMRDGKYAHAPLPIPSWARAESMSPRCITSRATARIMPGGLGRRFCSPRSRAELACPGTRRCPGPKRFAASARSIAGASPVRQASYRFRQFKSIYGLGCPLRLHTIDQQRQLE